MQAAEVKIVKSSTPTLNRVKKKMTNSIKNDLFNEISPIRRSVPYSEIAHAVKHDDDIENIKQKPKNFLELEEVLAELKLKRELSALNLNEGPPRNSDLSAVLQQIENLQVIPSRTRTLSISPMKPVNNKKSVFFKVAAPQNEDEEVQLKLRPGKWRKSLVAWRKSHHQLINRRQSSRKFVGLFPIKTDPNVIKRYTQKLEESLANNCKYNCHLIFEKSIFSSYSATQYIQTK